MRNHYVRSSLAAQTGEILDVDDVFGALAYTGSGSNGSGKSLTFGAGVDMLGKGGMGWVKNRTSSSTSHIIQDTVRGIQGSNQTSNGYAGVLSSDSYGGSGYSFNPQGTIKEFTSTGYKVVRGSSNSLSATNDNFSSYIAYAFRKAGGFFDIQTWTGNGVSGREIAHDLDSVPGAIWIKKLFGQSKDWWCYHRQTASSSPEDYYLVLNEKDSKVDSSTFMNDTAPTSTHFTVGNADNVNQNNQTYVAYIFGHNDARFGSSQDKSIIYCGGYTGNGSTNGPTVNIGWRPQFLIFKNPSHAMNWRMYDTERGIPAGNDPRLMPNLANAQEAFYDKLDLTSTGFKLQHTGSDMNQSGTLITFIAIREQW